MKTLLPILAAGILLLAGAPALAQTTPPATAPAALGTVVLDEYLLGRIYRVSTVQGTTFTGTLVSLSLTALEFDTQELGHVRLERTQVQRAELVAPIKAGAKPGYFDIGNGNRLFFAPTARGLRKGEGTLQDIDFYLLGFNYGITNNFSIGGYVSLLPGIALNDQLLVLTPKFSFPISDNLHVGAGLLYLRVPNNDNSINGSTGAGIGYGAITYGSADNNFTVGLGYGFVQGNIGGTPIIQIGGQTRVSRRISLISENYIVADSEAGMGGLYGIKINWRRTSLGLGAAYLYVFSYNDPNYSGYGPSNRGGYGGTTYILPVYYDFTFRFGKGAK